MTDSGKTPLTKLDALGEFGLIRHLTHNLHQIQPSTLTGVGDDAAVMDYQGQRTLVSTDMLVEGVHFDLTYVPLKHLGYKAIVVNLSDLYAMNGRPTQVTVSLAVSNRYTVEALEELYAGMRLACERYSVDLVGGDTTSSTSGMVISVTVLGVAEPEAITYRSGANLNDILVVTGDLGGAYMGLQLLEREKAVFQVNPGMQPQLEGYEYLLERQLKPEARKDIYDLLRELHITPTAMIDISDGLSSEVLHLCQSSNLGCRIYEEKLPIADKTFEVCEEFKLNVTTVALNGGEDYELLLAIDPLDFEKIKNHPDFTPIGHFTEAAEKANLVTRDGHFIELKAQGWNALLGKESGE